MKFLHILTHTLWNAERKFDFLTRNFNSEDHAILLLNYPEDSRCTSAKNVRACLSTDTLDPDTTSCIKDLFHEAQYIIWHGIFLPLPWLKWFDHFRTEEHKYVWVSQGTDLYGWECKNAKGLRAQKRETLFNHLGSEFRKRIPFFAAEFPSDKHYFLKNINPLGRVFELSYLDDEWLDLIAPFTPEDENVDIPTSSSAQDNKCGPDLQSEAQAVSEAHDAPEQQNTSEDVPDKSAKESPFEDWYEDLLLPEQKRALASNQTQQVQQPKLPKEKPWYPDRTLNFLVGVNRSPQNEHIAILNSLVNLRFRNIRLYIPLVGTEDYNPQYVERVINHAQLMFGDKAVCITQVSSKQDYIDLIAKADVVITRTTSRAVCSHDIYDSILTAFALNKVVCLSQKGALYRSLTNNEYPVLAAERVYNCPFDEFWTRVLQTKRPAAFEHQIHKCQLQSGWTQMFTSLDHITANTAPTIKFLHIFTHTPWNAERKVGFVTKHFNAKDHAVLLLNYPEDSRCTSSEHIRACLSTDKSDRDTMHQLETLFNEAQYIIWHGIFLPLPWLKWLDRFHAADDKYVWVSQGTDLYGWEVKDAKDTNSQLFNRLGAEFRKRIHFFAAEFSSDKYHFLKDINPYGRVFDLSYLDNEWLDLIERATPIEMPDIALPTPASLESDLAPDTESEVDLQPDAQDASEVQDAKEDPDSSDIHDSQEGHEDQENQEEQEAPDALEDQPPQDESEEELSDEELSDEELSDEELSDEDLHEDAIPEQELLSASQPDELSEEKPWYPERTLNFLVGVNKSPLNGHIAILNSLVNLKDKNVRLYIPLIGAKGYNPQYVKKVTDHAQRTFGEKAVCITELSSKQEYVDLIAGSDVVITRMTSSAPCCHDIYDSILTAYALKKVVCPSQKSALYRNLTSNNYAVLAAERVYSCPFEEFWTRVLATEQAEALEPLMDECQTHAGWTRMFSALEMERGPIKFLHIIRPSVELATPIIDIVQNNFDTTEHQFLMNRRIWIRRCEPFLRHPNVRLFLLGRTKLQRMRYMLDLMKRAENIVWHGFYVGYAKPVMDPKELLLVSAFPKLLKKTTWVGWGSDLHDWKADATIGGWKHRLKAKIFNYLGEKARRSIRVFVSIFPPDGDYFKEQYGDGPKVLDGTYSNRNFRSLLEDNKPALCQDNPNRPLNILVGHSANYWNYHMDMLKALAKYRYENIRIFIPLSTGGTKQYVDKVQQYARTLFGDKAVCVMQKVPLDKYIKFLWNMDVAVFRLERQAALSNLMNLLYMGKKVFLPAGTVMHDFFNSRDVKVWDTNQIENMSFDEFAALNKQAKPPRYILERTDQELNVQKWKKIFDTIEETNQE